MGNSMASQAQKGLPIITHNIAGNHFHASVTLIRLFERGGIFSLFHLIGRAQKNVHLELSFIVYFLDSKLSTLGRRTIIYHPETKKRANRPAMVPIGCSFISELLKRAKGSL